MNRPSAPVCRAKSTVSVPRTILQATIPGASNRVTASIESGSLGIPSIAQSNW